MGKMTGIFQIKSWPTCMSNGNVVTKRISLNWWTRPITRRKIAMISTNHNIASAALKRSHLSCSVGVSNWSYMPWSLFASEGTSAHKQLIKYPITAITTPRSEPATTWEMCRRWMLELGPSKALLIHLLI